MASETSPANAFGDDVFDHGDGGHRFGAPAPRATATRSPVAFTRARSSADAFQPS